MLFALIAGAGTAVTPCVLPVVPALLSASTTGGRRRPLGIVLGLALTFTITIVAGAKLVKGVGLGTGATRDAAIAVLIAFGLVMLIPGLAARVEAPLSRLARFGPRQRGSGFWTGMAVGGALGFVCLPCAGPILAAVIAVSAHGGASVRIVAVAISYALGLGAVMLLYGIGGRAVLGRIKRVAKGHVVERVLGVVLLVTGVALAFNLDTRFEEDLAGSSLPAFLLDPTRALENSNAVQNRLASLRPPSKFATRQREAAARPVSPRHSTSAGAGVAIPGVQTPRLSDLGAAPNFTDNQRWFNTPGGRPLSLAGLRGHVVLVDFWTYTCINCIRTLPFVKGLYAAYHRDGFEVVGVETPEFTFEQNASNVQQAINSDGIRYPVVQDNNYGTWNAYGNQYWPAEYLIDSTGQVRHVQFGEGDYGQSEAAVRELLYQSGHHHLPPPSAAHAIMPTQVGTPETYLDDQHSPTPPVQFVQPLHPGVSSYLGVTSPQPNQLALQGTWRTTSQSVTPLSSGASITFNFLAAHAYLVMTSQGNGPRHVRVLLDGHPIPAGAAGSDVHHGLVTVRGERLYSLVSLPNDQPHVLTLDLPPGVSAYDFTFG